MRTNLTAAAIVAALLSTATAVAMDQHSQSRYAIKNIPVAKNHRDAPPMESRATAKATIIRDPATPAVLKVIPVSIETGTRERKRAALTTLLFISATCLGTQGKVFVAHRGC